MHKIKLDLGRLNVDSFTTAAVDERLRGMVNGHYSQVGTCGGRVATCQYGGTCDAGCGTRRTCTIEII